MTKGCWLGRKAEGEKSDHEFYTTQNQSVNDLEMPCEFGRLGEKILCLALTLIISGKNQTVFQVLEKSGIHFTLLQQCNTISGNGVMHILARAEFGFLGVPLCSRLLRTVSFELGSSNKMWSLIWISQTLKVCGPMVWSHIVTTAQYQAGHLPGTSYSPPEGHPCMHWFSF